ncbi:MAG: type II secretion system F family protein [Polyangiaceae bacterium]|nr:type II secretion system F family protein [Polyangiaceae bacterium]
MSQLLMLRYVMLSLVLVASVSFVAALLRVRPLGEGRRGYRARARDQALAESGGFRLVEPMVRWMGGIVHDTLGLFPNSPSVAAFRARQARRLEQAGDYLGLAPDEFSGAMVLAMVVFGLVGFGLSELTGQGMLYLVLGVVGGPAIIHLQVESAMRLRLKSIGRRLPAAIDLAALCTSAGLDFPSSLAMVAREAPAGDPLGAEIERLLAALNLGQTRREALAAFEQRTPASSVRDLVRALTQAEEKGTPISEALLTQANVSRGQRTVMAEEAATRAGVLMIIPMVFVFGCILLLLMGPFIVTGAGF